MKSTLVNPKLGELSHEKSPGKNPPKGGAPVYISIFTMLYDTLW